jgi:hypothetical protein
VIAIVDSGGHAEPEDHLGRQDVEVVQIDDDAALAAHLDIAHLIGSASNRPDDN